MTDPIMTLSEQVDRLIAENRRYRAKSEDDEKTILLYKTQYKTLAAQVKEIRETAQREVEHARSTAAADVQDMEIELDEAKGAYREIESILNQTAAFLAQGLHARIGNATPEKMPKPAPQSVSGDERIPQIGLAS